MPTRRQVFGTESERRAADFLRAKGFQTLDAHVTSRYGEIDLLMLDGPTVVAVEVKARRSRAYGAAVESLTDRKLQHIADTLYIVLQQRGWERRPFRIDVVTIEGQHIRHYPGVG